jgi:hypothetical protein
MGLRFFPEDHSEAKMATWYGRALEQAAQVLSAANLQSKIPPSVNLYELIDPHSNSIAGSSSLVDIEYYFGLLRRDGTPKPAFEVVKQAIAGNLKAATKGTRVHSGPLQIYMEASKISRGFHRWMGPRLVALYKMVTPPIRRPNQLMVGFSALWLIYLALRRASKD